MSESMIEKLARAGCTYRWSCVCDGNPDTGVRKFHVYEGDGHWRDSTVALFDTAAEAKSYTRHMNVRAVLQALREPDEGMVDALWQTTREDAVGRWQAAIDHVLNEQSA